MSTSELLVESPGAGVVLITLNRPAARNSIPTAMQRDLDEVLRRLRTDDAVRAVVITGAGDKAFSSGYDIKELRGFDEEGTLRNYEERRPLVWNFATFPKPFIGAINGSAHGAGAILAVALDIRVGSLQTDFRFTAAAYGGVNNTWHLPKVVGLARALEFTMTARRIFGEEALHAGLLNQVVEPGAVLDKALEIAAQIAAHPPLGIAWTKALMHAGVERGLREAYEAENEVMVKSFRPGRPAELFSGFLSKPKS